MLSFIKQTAIRHLQWYRNMPKWKFLAIATIEGTALPYLFICICSMVFTMPTSALDDESELYIKSKFLLVNIMAPMVETILLQIIPVFIARRFKSGFNGQLLAAWIPFAAMHFFNDMYSGICAGIIGGFYVAFTYAHWRQESLWSATWITMAHHSLSNTLYTLIDAIEGSASKVG